MERQPEDQVPVTSGNDGEAASARDTTGGELEMLGNAYKQVDRARALRGVLGG
jgi:hypothetical protein